MMNTKKIYRVAATFTCAVAAAVGFYLSENEPQEFAGEFGNGQFRQVKSKTVSPYAQFGDSSFVLMTDEEREGRHVLSIENQGKSGDTV